MTTQDIEKARAILEEASQGTLRLLDLSPKPLLPPHPKSRVPDLFAVLWHLETVVQGASMGLIHDPECVAAQLRDVAQGHYT